MIPARDQPLPHREIRMDTVGALLDDGNVSVFARCRSCPHQVKLDLAAIAANSGRDVTLPRLKVGLKCSACGKRGAELTVAHSGRPG